MTTQSDPSTTSAWGTGTARATGGAIPFVQYEPRRHRLPELLVEAARWDARLSGRLAHFEVPTRWWIWTEQLPANDAGKVDKGRLREAWPASG